MPRSEYAPAAARDQLRMQKPLIVRAELALPFGRLLEP